MGVSEPGTPLDGSGSKFRSKWRARELRSIYGDPFGEDFVPDWVPGPARTLFYYKIQYYFLDKKTIFSFVTIQTFNTCGGHCF